MHDHSTAQTTFANKATHHHYLATGQREATLYFGDFVVHYTYEEDHEGDYLFIKYEGDVAEYGCIYEL